MNRTYGTGDANFDLVFENALNGIDPNALSSDELKLHEKWVNDNWGELNNIPDEIK